MEKLLLLWADLDVWLVMVIFVAYVLLDGLYAISTLAIANLRPGKAATTGAITYILLAVGVISYIENILYLVPIVAGSWVGTYVVVGKRKQKKRSASL